MTRRAASASPGCFWPGLTLLLGLLIAAWLLPPLWAGQVFGPSTQTGLAAWRYSALVLWHDGLLTEPLDPGGQERLFAVSPGSSVQQVAERLQSEGFIRSAQAFSDYLVYAGLDTRLQSGDFRLSAALNALQIARALQDATPQEVPFVVLPGWRMEEIAAALPTSGLSFSQAEFLALAAAPPWGFPDLPPGASAEGFLAPGEYRFDRQVSAADFVSEMLRRAEQTSARSCARASAAKISARTRLSSWLPSFSVRPFTAKNNPKSLPSFSTAWRWE